MTSPYPTERSCHRNMTREKAHQKTSNHGQSHNWTHKNRRKQSESDYPPPISILLNTAEDNFIVEISEICIPFSPIMHSCLLSNKLYHYNTVRKRESIASCLYCFLSIMIPLRFLPTGNYSTGDFRALLRCARNDRGEKYHCVSYRLETIREGFPIRLDSSLFLTDRKLFTRKNPAG